MTVASAETTSLAAAKTFLADLAAHLGQLIGRIGTARATLASRGLDTDTLNRIDRVRAQTNLLAASCAAGVEHLTDYHAQMEQAVTNTPEAADTDFYQPGTTATAAATAKGIIGEQPDQPPAPDDERERLARGLYIGAWPAKWQRDRAREWDAGRVDADERAEVYARADEILAERARIAGGPAADRLDMMRSSGVTRCPDWCPQPDDEDQYEEHLGAGQVFQTEGLDEVTVRPRVSWWADGEPTVDLVVTARDEGGPGTLTLTGADLLRLQQVTTEALDEAEWEQRAPAGSGKPAYPGAEYDAADAVHEVLDPAVAAAALDAAARTGTFHLSDADDAPGMDWSDCDDSGIRRLQASDGEQTAEIELNPDELADLRDELGRLVGLVDDGRPAADIWTPGDEINGAYIDWSITTDGGGRQVEIGDDDGQPAQFELTPDQLRDWFQRLDLQVHLDTNDGLDLPTQGTPR